MGNQGKMTGKSKICVGIKSQLIVPEFIYIYHVLFEKCNLWADLHSIIVQDKFLENLNFSIHFL